MSDIPILRIDGEVDRPAAFSLAELAAFDSQYQVPDVSRLDPKRRGQALTLAGLLARVGARATAHFLTLHATADDFHASIPLEAVRDRAILIYEVDGQALPASAGGPLRFLIPDYAACQTDEIDECANVKFVDWIELSRTRGHDNRPADEREHARLHQNTPKPG